MRQRPLDIPARADRWRRARVGLFLALCACWSMVAAEGAVAQDGAPVFALEGTALEGPQEGPVIAVLDTLDLNARVPGSLLATATTITGSVEAEGMVILGAGQVTLQTVRAPLIVISGADIRIDGVVEGDVIAIGGQLTQTMNAIIRGDLTVMTLSATLFGEVTGTVRAATGTLRHTGNIGGDLIYAAGSATSGAMAEVAGEVVSADGDTPHLADSVTGAATPETELTTLELMNDLARQIQPLQLAILLLGHLVLGLLLIWRAPAFTLAAVARARHRWWSSLGWTVATLAGVAVAAAVLALSWIGIAFAIALVALLPVLFQIGWTIGMMRWGESLSRRLPAIPGLGPRRRRAVGFALACAVFALTFWALPLALVISIALFTLGLGAFARTLAEGPVAWRAGAAAQPA